MRRALIRADSRHPPLPPPCPQYSSICRSPALPSFGSATLIRADGGHRPPPPPCLLQSVTSFSHCMLAGVRHCRAGGAALGAGFHCAQGHERRGVRGGGGGEGQGGRTGQSTGVGGRSGWTGGWRGVERGGVRAGRGGACLAADQPHCPFSPFMPHNPFFHGRRRKQPATRQIG